jgi:hypothetical protein
MKWLAALVLCCFLGGCEIHVKIGNPGPEPEWKKKPWVAWATSRSSGNPEFFFAYYESRDSCLRGVKDFLSGPTAKWYREPDGCGYRGTDFAPLLYIMNRIYASDAMECVVALSEPGEGPAHMVVAKGQSRETKVWRCVWG